MRTTTLLGAALVLAMSAPAHAVDLYSAPLFTGFYLGNNLECTVLNSGANTIKVTIRLIDVSNNLDVRGEIKKCGPISIGAGHRLSCFKEALDNLAYCQVTTPNAAVTEANFAVLDSFGQTEATSLPR